MELEFKDKRFLVTGVGSGIGRSLAIELSKMGAEVWGVSKTKGKLESLAVSKINKIFEKVFFLISRKSVQNCIVYTWI